MSRKRLHEIEPWLCGKNCEGRGQTFIRLTSDLMCSEPFSSLSNGAQLLYLRMCLASAGKPEFQYTYSQYKAFLTKPSFIRCRNELVEADFIEIVERNGNLRLPNVYRFSLRWKARL